jgi:hypothetical protein
MDQIYMTDGTSTWFDKETSEHFQSPTNAKESLYLTDSNNWILVTVLCEGNEYWEEYQHVSADKANKWMREQH